MKISPTLKAKMISEERKKQNLPIYDGGLGENHFNPPSELIETLQENAHLKQYTSIEGTDNFKNIVKQYYTTKNFIPKFTMVGNGLKELIYLLITSWEENIILISPCWVTYLEDMRILNKKHLLFETKIEDNFKINFEKMELTLKDNQHSLLFLNNPHNPTGIVYPPEDIEKLANLCKKYNITVFEDSIYYNMSMEPIKRISEFYDKVIIGSSLSKDWASSGWRFGWIVIGEKLNDLYNKMKSIGCSMYSCPTHFMNNVGTKALMLLDEKSDYFNNMREHYNMMHQKIINKIKNSNIIYSKPGGSWYILLDFRNYNYFLKANNINTSNELMFHLINKFGIITVSGEAFGSKELCLRISLVNEKILEGIDILLNWLC